MIKEVRNMHCNSETFNIGHLYAIRNSIEENPDYQRESAIWSPQRQELFIDSLVNGYDIPKIYFHDLRTLKQLKKFAIIDGKQRLYTIYRFLNNDFPLATGFKINDDTDFQEVKSEMYFKDFSIEDQELFKNISLTIVLIINATEDDIEDLFFRLNNGEPLNGAESRNAFGGNMALLIKELVVHPFFTKKLRFKNKRYSHLEIAAKFVLLEMADMNNNGMFSDLKKKYLDEMVRNNKILTNAQKEGIISRVRKNLNALCKVFSDSDPLLSKQVSPPLYYIYIKIINMEYGHRNLNTIVKTFLDQFEIKRVLNNHEPEEKREPVLTEFTRLMQQGTNDITGLRQRIAILTRHFLLDNPDVRLVDKRRHFSQEERYVIYQLSGKQCASCHKELPDIKEMEADHIDQFKFGGETSLKNARALCGECNLKEKKNVQ